MTPRTVSPRLCAALGLGLLCAVSTLAPRPAHALKVATWNLIDYPNTNLAGRQPHIRTVMAALDPDVIVLQELKTEAGRDSFLNNVLNVIQPGQWAASNFFNTAESAAFYKTAKINLTFTGGAIDLPPGPRDALAVRLRFPGYVSRFAEFQIYSIHFKAGTPTPGTTDSTTRRQESTALRNNLNNRNLAALTPNVLIAGDTNFYGDWEGGYIRLTESQADNDGRMFDLFSLPGTWRQFAYRSHHTQSTCLSGDCPGGWSSGGLDDRFDFFLWSNVVNDGEGLDFVPGSWHYFGNDGQHYNAAVDGSGFNSDVGLAVATALRLSSDHLPVIITLQAPAKISAASQIDFGRVIVGATAQQTLNVSNPAVAPADELTYTLTAPSGFTAPAGTFAVNTGAAPNAHLLSMSTGVPAFRNGALVVPNDDPDSSAKSVQLSGVVLAHAAPSLDSATVVHSDTLDFGAHVAGGFSDLDACAWNQGWNSLQSRYLLSGGVITGGAGRFTFVGGFTPAEVSGAPACFAIHFDDSGATPDSTYEATLTFSGSDEAVPGGTAGTNLVVTLRARVTTNVGVPTTLPARLVFLPPAPNPFRDRVELRFELPRAGRVSLDVFDLGGRHVASILEGDRPAGSHAVRWSPVDRDGARLEAGLYFVRFDAEGLAITRRLALLP